MLYKKRAGFLLSIILLLLIILPGVFALFEGAYGLFSAPTDLISLYRAWSSWIDFTIFFLIIASLARLVFGKIYGVEGEEEHPGLKGLYLGVGLFGAFGLILFGRSVGWSDGLLLHFGPLWFIIVLIALIATIYRAIKGEEKDAFSIGVIFFFIFLALLIGSIIFPQLFAPILAFIFKNPIIALIFIILGLLSLLSLGNKLSGIKIFKRKEGGERAEAPSERDSRREIEQTPRLPRLEKINVEILIYPNGPYKVNDPITLVAKVTTSRWARKKAVRGNFACTWYIDNLQLDNHNTTIDYVIPQDIINQPEQKVWVTVTVVDVDNPTRTDTDREYIKISANIPVLKIIKPDTERNRNLRAIKDEFVDFEYKIEGATPREFSDVYWLYTEGVVANIDQNVLRRSKVFKQGNKFDMKIGAGPLTLEEGKVYTIICAAVDRNRKYYQIPIINKPLADYFTIELMPSEKPQFLVNVFKKEGNKRILVESSFNNFTINARLNETYYFLSAVQNDEIANYDVEIATNAQELFRYDTRLKSAVIILRNPGRKTVLCVFRKGRNILATIDATINVSSGQQTIPPTQRASTTQYSFIAITRPSIRTTSMRTPVAVNYDEGIDFGVGGASKDIVDFSWIICANHIEQPSKKIIKTLSAWDKFTFKFDKNIFPEGPYSVFVFGYNSRKEIVATDFVWLNLVGGPNLKKTEEKMEDSWQEFEKWGKRQKYVGSPKISPPWLSFKKFLKEEKNITPDSESIDKKTFDNISSKVWKRNART